jgi:glutathione S-transferase
MSRMTLFDNAFSPFAYKVRVALYEKGVEFEKRALRTAAEREELRRRNPRDEVPALQDGEAVIYDSTVICEYLEDRYPSPRLLPVDPVERARCRALELVSDTQLDACLFVMGLVKPSRDLQSRVPDALSQAGVTLAKHHANLERELAGGDYFVGGELSLADIAIYPHLRSAVFLGYPVGERCPGLQAWMTTSNP